MYNSTSSYGANSSYGNRGNGSGYGGNNYGGNGNSGYGGNNYGSAQESGNYGGNQYGGNQYGGNQYGGNQYGGNQYGGNQYGGYNQGPVPGQETEEDVDRVAQEIRDTRQESLQSTRNAIRALQEANDSADRTMHQLSEQSQQLGRVERSLDVSQLHAEAAQEKTSELKAANKMFGFHISNPFSSSKKKREAALEAAKAQAAKEMEDRDRIRKEEYETGQRMKEASGQGPYGRNNGANNYTSQSNNYGSSDQYMFEANDEDRAAESQINQDLDVMSGLLGGLKNKANAMNVEVNRQNQRIDGINTKAVNLGGHIDHNTRALNNFSKRA
ncbi:Protein transport protein S9 plasma membrane t-SNARE [Mortierella sp. NVP85]|nr:Protein transport protein S9 plasma membrane t-SNARE [Mortierella sp. NVP85]